MNEFGHIYSFTNTINNKMYIGQSINVERRIHEHLKCREINRYSLLIKALIKYGIKSFDIKIIDTAINIDELNSKEKQYILQYKSNDKKLGYNIESGGNNAIPTIETLEKMSRSHQGIKQTDSWINKRVAKAGTENAKKYGRRKTEEEKLILSVNSPKFWLGKTRDDETRRKISKTKKERGLSSLQKEIICKKVFKIDLKTNKIITYESTGIASNFEGVNQSTISRWCSKNKIIDNILWRY